MALGRSPPPEIRSPDERGGAEDDAEAEEEEVFDDAFDIPHKNAPHDRLRRWRQAALVLNASRRFRYTLDLKKEEEKEIIRRKIRSHAQVIRAAFLFKEAGQKDIREAYTGINLATASRSFPIELEKLTTLNREHDGVLLQEVGGVRGLSDLLKSNLDRGISPNEDELLQRRNAYGANTYPRKKRKNILRFLFEACQDLTLVILMVAAAISLTLGMTTEGVDEGWYDGGSIFLAVLLVILVTAISDYRQSLQFRHLNEEKQNIQVEVVRGGKRFGASIFDLVVGDVVPLKIGDQVPADGILISGHSLAIDESSMTGESKIVHKDQKAPFLMSGCKVADGYGSMLVTGVGTNTEWGQLMANLSEDNGEETPLQVRLNGVATFIGLVGLSVAGAVLVVLWIRYFTGHTENPDGTTQFVAGSTGVKQGFMGAIRILTIAVTIVVVAVPEGLPLAVTLTLAYSMKKMMRDKALVRRLSSCETMGSATTICSDKTGTLTLNKMTIVEAYFGGTKLDPCCNISKMSDNATSLIIEGIAQNTTGTVFLPEDGGAAELTASPTEKAILSWGLQLGMDFHDVRSKSSVLHVFPFNSEKKRGAVAVQSDDGVHIHWKGAAEIVVSSCKSWLSADGSVQPMSAEKHDEYKKSIEDMAASSLRCVAFAYCPCEIEMIPMEDIANWKLPEDDLTLLGVVGIKDPCRPGVRDAVRLCTSAGVKVRMVTGDNIETAKAIALECGILDANGVISEPVVIEGKVFREMSESARGENADKIIVMGRSSPNDKLLLVQALKRKGHVVAVTGDGTNDAPALHEADIGLSMGISGTEVAKESSDIIILDDDFTSVVKVVRWGRSVYANIQKFIQFQLTVNVAALVINVVAAVSSGDVPLNAVELLWVNLIMDTLGALALATEPPTDNLMKRNPVGRREPLVTNIMWRNLFVQALYQVVVLLIFDFAGIRILQLQNESRYNAEKIKNTFIFNTFVFCQVFNEFNARKPEERNVFKGVTKNHLFMGIIGITTVFQILIIEFLGKFFKTVRLNWRLWLVSVAIGLISWPLAYLGKFIPVPVRPLQDYFKPYSCWKTSCRDEEGGQT
ncbi:calcium-transporting ATPase 5, plasma membrane-type-like isoform X1 [Phragmites australis]|uniref:calcium-transporting ATPase 5, plasma membrane-type-like isoform X1 n=1 Tax=Phragmites australis TaxID=29695 RepID=UPI002D7A2AAD|nr:calcium-transporting ATPase 5, plasma membrane-type-like isoform X1 [Phragmites australis]